MTPPPHCPTHGISPRKKALWSPPQQRSWLSWNGKKLCAVSDSPLKSPLNLRNTMWFLSGFFPCIVLFYTKPKCCNYLHLFLNTCLPETDACVMHTPLLFLFLFLFYLCKYLVIVQKFSLSLFFLEMICARKYQTNCSSLCVCMRMCVHKIYCVYMSNLSSLHL